MKRFLLLALLLTGCDPSSGNPDLEDSRICENPEKFALACPHMSAYCVLCVQRGGRITCAPAASCRGRK